MSRTIGEFLWARGITHIDGVVLSHADVDHFNALPTLLERFSVGVVYVSPLMFREDHPSIRVLHEAILRAKVPLREVHAGDRLRVGQDCTAEVLHPPPGGVFGSTNANSIVLLVSYRGRGILLPGDLDTPGLEEVLAEEPRHCEVLLAPHHGSRRSHPRGLIAWTTPQWIIISGAYERDFQEVAATYRALGHSFLHTAEQGAVTARLDQDGLWVHGYAPRPAR